MTIEGLSFQWPPGPYVQRGDAGLFGLHSLQLHKDRGGTKLIFSAPDVCYDIPIPATDTVGGYSMPAADPVGPTGAKPLVLLPLIFLGSMLLIWRRMSRLD